MVPVSVNTAAGMRLLCREVSDILLDRQVRVKSGSNGSRKGNSGVRDHVAALMLRSLSPWQPAKQLYFSMFGCSSPAQSFLPFFYMRSIQTFADPWLAVAPTPRSSGGRSAVKTINGKFVASASQIAG